MTLKETIEAVETFHNAFKIDNNYTPVAVLSDSDVTLRYNLMKEDNLNEEDAVEKMIDISSRPSIMNMFNFGKYNGKTVEEVAQTDRGYLEWMLTQKEQNNSENEEDWIYTLKHYLNK